MNHVIFEGNLTKEPVFKYSNNTNKPMATGTIGVYQGKDAAGNDLESLFIDFVCYNKDAEAMSQFGHKGDPVVIYGTFQETTNTTEDGRVFHNKKVVGKAKLYKKAAPVSNAMPQQAVAQMPQQAAYMPYTNQMAQQPTSMAQAAPQNQVHQQPMAQMPQQNVNIW